MTISDAIREATLRLTPVSTSPALDAELLCAYACGVSRSAVLARGPEALSENAAEVFAMVVQQRLDGMPVAYIRGEQEFYGHAFIVNRSVLIPRPETELLIDEVKTWVNKKITASSPSTVRILDIGTGSGCIAVTLAKELFGLRSAEAKKKSKPSTQTDQSRILVVGTDIDPDALVIAQRNASRLGAEVQFRTGDCYDACVACELFDVIVSNPPYVPLERIAAATPEAMGLRYEPVHALTPLTGPHTSIVERIITQAPQWLAPEGILVVEIGEDMGEQAVGWATATFPKRTVEIVKEWSGADRVLVVK